MGGQEESSAPLSAAAGNLGKHGPNKPARSALAGLLQHNNKHEQERESRTMPLADGTNAEKEMPEPAIEWKGKEDLKEVKLYGNPSSPPFVKVEMILKYYEVPYTTVAMGPGSGVTKESSYKKVPVLTASGRTVNDSSIICKVLFKALGEKNDEEMDATITYGLQPALEVEAFATGAELKQYAMKWGFWFLVFVPSFFVAYLSPAASIKKKYPDLKSTAEYGQVFKNSFDTDFWGGDKPGSQDLSYFGTLYPFAAAGCPTAIKHLNDTGLKPWYDRMLLKLDPILPKD